MAIRQLIARHDALRTVFSQDGRTLCVLAARDDAIHHVDLGHLAQRDQAVRLDALRRSCVTTPFDLVDGPLLQAHIVRLHPQEHHLILTVHHIVCDGWSWNTLLDDLRRMLADPAVAPQLPPAAAFCEHAIARSRADVGPGSRIADARAHWVEKIAGAGAATALPTDRPRLPVRTYAAARLEHRIDARWVAGVRARGAQRGCTLFSSLLTAFAVFMHRVTQQEEIVVGMTAAGQLDADQQALVGHSVHLLPLPLRVDPQADIETLLSTVNRAVLDAFEHRQVTLLEILAHSDRPRDPSHLAVMPVRFNLGREIDEEVADFGGVQADLFTNQRRFEIFELFLDARASRGGLTVECYYNTDLFDAETIHRWLAGLEALLRSMVDAPHGQPVAALAMASRAERDRLADCRVPGNGWPRYPELPAGARIAIVDRDGRQLPIGVEGTVQILADDVSAPRRRTGVRGRHRADGSIEIVGRAANRVSIRGFSFQLEALERVLVEHPAVQDAVAAVREDADGLSACAAWLVPVSGSEPDLDDVRAFLRDRLPGYMVPTRYALVEALPRTAHGAPDRDALARFAPPAEDPGLPSAVERTVLAVWRDLLPRAPIALSDDFFALGGSSLLAARMAREIHRRLGIAVSPAVVLRHRTPALLAQALAAQAPTQGEGTVERDP
ncbi:MAG: condensation domain-containing protein [Acidobacteriota bacterium]